MHISTGNSVSPDSSSELCCPATFVHAAETNFLPSCTPESAKEIYLPSCHSDVPRKDCLPPLFGPGSIYTCPWQAASLLSLLTATTTQGRNLPPPSQGPVLIRKWEQQPSIRVILACYFPPFLDRDLPETGAIVMFLVNSPVLIFTTYRVTALH